MTCQRSRPSEAKVGTPSPPSPPVPTEPVCFGELPGLAQNEGGSVGQLLGGVNRTFLISSAMLFPNSVPTPKGSNVKGASAGAALRAQAARPLRVWRITFSPRRRRGRARRPTKTVSAFWTGFAKFEVVASFRYLAVVEFWFLSSPNARPAMAFGLLAHNGVSLFGVDSGRIRDLDLG